MHIHWLSVLRDVGIFLGLNFIGNQAALFLVRSMAEDDMGQALTIVGITKMSVNVIAFVLAGGLVRSGRFLHGLIVALVAWGVACISVLIGHSFIQWLLLLPQILVSMLIGIGLSFLLFRSPSTAEELEEADNG